jgi:hypothetical protein
LASTKLAAILGPAQGLKSGKMWNNIQFHDYERLKSSMMFQYESADEVIADHQEHFHGNCFSTILNTAVSSTDSRTLQLKSTYELFGFLYHFRDLTREQMIKSAKDLEIHALISCDKSSDIEGYRLAEEMIAFRNIRSTIPTVLQTQYIF